MKIEITISNLENVGDVDKETIKRIEAIVSAIMQAGGFTGVKSGKTILHFDKFGDFRGVQLDYWPWEKRAS